MYNLERLKKRVFDLDNNACFIERECILSALERCADEIAEEEKAWNAV